MKISGKPGNVGAISLLSSLQKMSETIFIVSGGTGGHIIPARCLALFLAKENRIFFLGDKKIKNYCKKNDGFSSIIISSSQLRESPIFLIKAITKICFGILQSCFFLLTLKPKYVIAFGGYATFPVLAASVITRTKIILHEQNSHLGKVNRIFANYAKKIALTFPETSGISERNLTKIIFTGNPIRQEILQLNKIPYELPEQASEEVSEIRNNMGYDLLLASDFYLKQPEEKAQKFFKILVIGGSGGAKIFSKILPKAFFNLSNDIKDFIQVTQQCRAELVQQTFEQYKSFNINIVVDSFFENMAEIIRDSHLVIARSGSSSIFEFCAAKKPMILVPFAAAADNHQEKNARYLEKNGAAIVVPEEDFTINKINSLLRELMNNISILQKMSESAGAMAVLDATQNLAKLIND